MYLSAAVTIGTQIAASGLTFNTETQKNNWEIEKLSDWEIE